MVSDKVMQEVAVQLEENGEMNQLKKQLTSDPELREFVAEGAGADSSALPFKTKEEAVRKLIRTFSVSELEKIQSSMQGGLTAENKKELITTLESKLTEEELLALKAIAYKELNK